MLQNHKVSNKILVIYDIGCSHSRYFMATKDDKVVKIIFIFYN